VAGSHGDLDVVNQAFAGADSVFCWCRRIPMPTAAGAAYVDFTQPACNAFTNQGVARVVGVSALGRGTPWAANAGLMTASLQMDDLIVSTGVGYRALTMPSFMDNLLRQIASIKNEGTFSLPISGDLKQPSCATRDIAAAGANLVLDHSWSGHGHVAVLGPEDLSYNDMARIVSEVLGKPVRFQQISGEAYKARLLARGMSEAMAEGNLDMWVACNQGLTTAEPRTPNPRPPPASANGVKKYSSQPSSPDLSPTARCALTETAGSSVMSEIRHSGPSSASPQPQAAAPGQHLRRMPRHVQGNPGRVARSALGSQSALRDHVNSLPTYGRRR
jgi:uncharacterized protein YbjT (DUF2867 family)